MEHISALIGLATAIGVVGLIALKNTASIRVIKSVLLGKSGNSTEGVVDKLDRMERKLDQVYTEVEHNRLVSNAVIHGVVDAINEATDADVEPHDIKPEWLLSDDTLENYRE